MGTSSADQRKIVTGDNGYVLEDVPHLSDYIPDLPQSHNHLNTMGRTSYYKITTGVILRCITQVPKSRGRVLARIEDFTVHYGTLGALAIWKL
ncbi:hypothetical protein CsSME_00007646 [Camellia sinensis var. sinensis]